MRIRTADLLLTMVMLYLLSYRGTRHHNQGGADAQRYTATDPEGQSEWSGPRGRSYG